MVVHIATILNHIVPDDPEVNLYRIFVPQQARGRLGLTEALQFIFQIDWWIIFGASMIWCVQAIWDLNAMGKMKMGPLQGALCVVVGAVVIGPGATLVLVWELREERLVDSWKSKRS